MITTGAWEEAFVGEERVRGKDCFCLYCYLVGQGDVESSLVYRPASPQLP